MTETKHTPTPWFRICDGTEIRARQNDGYRIVASTDTVYLSTQADRGPEDDANAAFIILACNAHDDLLAQRNALAEAVESFLMTPTDVFSKARTAPKKGNGEA